MSSEFMSLTLTYTLYLEYLFNSEVLLSLKLIYFEFLLNTIVALELGKQDNMFN
jgi:hypothetical protein